jgi:hypothetical protein
VNGQLSFDDCLPDWPAVDPQPQQHPAGTRYWPSPQSDLRGQRLPASRCRIITIPIVGEYV